MNRIEQQVVKLVSEPEKRWYLDRLKTYFPDMSEDDLTKTVNLVVPLVKLQYPILKETLQKGLSKAA